MRRTERSLVKEYRSATETALTVLDPGNHATAVALSELPDGVRGYEEVKLRTVATSGVSGRTEPDRVARYRLTGGRCSY